MKILISEYVLSSYQYHYLELLPEAYAMVISLAEALSAAGCDVYLTISDKIPRILWDRVITVSSESEYYYLVERVREYFDWIVFIAPPLELIKLSKIAGEKLLGPSHFLVETFSDKLNTYIVLEKCGIKTPRSIPVDSLHIDRSRIKELNPPYIVKPTLLAGSECVYFARDVDEALQYARRAVKCDPSGRALVQEYVSGVHGSISVIYGKGCYLLYSLNLQLIILDENRIRYVGGVLPIRNHVFRKRTEVVLSKLYECYPELRGYIGLDVVWSKDDMYVIEVNPRATTSITGIYEVFPRLGDFLIKSVSMQECTSEHCFLGDLVCDYAYYLILDKTTPILTNERSIGIEGSSHSILVGRSRFKDNVINRIIELVSISKLTYNLDEALL